MSVLEHGLPASLFTRRASIATGLGIAAIVILCFNIYSAISYYVSEPKTAPACFGRRVAAGQKIIFPPGSGDGYRRAVNDRRSNISNEKIEQALALCTPESCPRGAWKEYRSAMFSYFASRLYHTSRLYRDYGDAGLSHARLLYLQPIDLKVEQGLRERYAAKVFRLNDFKQNHAAISIIVLKGADALRPCGAGEPAEDD